MENSSLLSAFLLGTWQTIYQVPKRPSAKFESKKHKTNGKKINLGRAPPASARPSPSQDASHNIFHAKSARYRGQHDSNR